VLYRTPWTKTRSNMWYKKKLKGIFFRRAPSNILLVLRIYNTRGLLQNKIRHPVRFVILSFPSSSLAQTSCPTPAASRPNPARQHRGLTSHRCMVVLRPQPALPTTDRLCRDTQHLATYHATSAPSSMQRGYYKPSSTETLTCRQQGLLPPPADELCLAHELFFFTNFLS
jgi:hypothetical protein